MERVCEENSLWKGLWGALSVPPPSLSVCPSPQAWREGLGYVYPVLEGLSSLASTKHMGSLRGDTQNEGELLLHGDWPASPKLVGTGEA